MKTQKSLNEIQKKRASKLSKKLKDAVRVQNYEIAAAAYRDLSSLLAPLGQNTRIYKARNLLFRVSIDTDRLDGVEQGLEILTERLKPNTKGWLTAHSLLAILFLRTGDLHRAKSHIEITLGNESVIKTEKRRRLFHSQFIERLEEEAIIYTLKQQEHTEIDVENLSSAVAQLFERNLTEAEITIQIADIAPSATSQLLIQVDQFVRKQLPYRNVILSLPDPATTQGREFVGKKIFKALKRRTYVGICDPNSQVNKVWTEHGIGGLFTGSVVGTALAASFARADIACGTIAVPFLALLAKIGVEAACESISSEPDFLN